MVSTRSNMNYGSIVDKRKATIIKKREGKEHAKISYKKKQILKEVVKHVQTKHIAEDKKEIVNDNINMLKKYKSNDGVITKHLKYKYKDNKNAVVQYQVSGNKLTKKTILAMVEKVKAAYASNNKNVMIEVALKYNEAWRTGKFTTVNEPIDIYDPIEYEKLISVNGKSYTSKIDDQKYFKQFDIFVVDTPAPRGGADNFTNSCFYNCLNKILFDGMPWATDAELKAFLKIPHYNKIAVSDIPKIEKALKNIKINVSGDYTYISSISSNKCINLLLSNEHYTLLNKSNSTILKQVHFTQKQPIILDKFNNTIFKDGKICNISVKERNELYNNKGDSKYIIINKSNNDNTLEQEYNNFIRIADTLKSETDGEINLYKTGSYKVASLNLFDKFTKHIETEKIGQLEAEFIAGAKGGALMYCNEYKGPAYKYDVKSFYLSIMQSGQMFPIKAGEFKYISNVELKEILFPSYGIYKCKITPLNNDDKATNNLFRFKANNYYTHIDIKRARELSFNIEMVEGDEANFIYYSRDKLITCTEVFKPYINILFPLKEKKINGAKDILTMLWGALCEKDIKKHYNKVDDEIIINDDIISLKRSLKNDDILMTTSKPSKRFVYNYARLAPFLISKGRLTMSNILEPYKNDVVKVHTDGVIFKNEPKDIKLGCSIGELLYEGKAEYFNIKNMNNYSGRTVKGIKQSSIFNI